MRAHIRGLELTKVDENGQVAKRVRSAFFSTTTVDECVNIKIVIVDV